MSSILPDHPVSPRTFVEEIVPALFAEAIAAHGRAVEAGDVPAAPENFELKLGLVLTGDDVGSGASGSDESSESADHGGVWALRIVDRELEVTRGGAPDCQVTVVQSIADWRAALWEGRPTLAADVVDALRTRGFEGLAAVRQGDAAPRNPAALRELENLPGRIDAIIAGDREPDWSIAVHIGPGPVPETPAATVRIGAAEADAIRDGSLHPLEALMTGQLRLEGDLGLVLQLQAIAMAASMPPPDRS